MKLSNTPWCVAAALVGLASPSPAQVSDPALIFAPDLDHVPLSAFLDSSASTTVAVHPEILEWIDANGYTIELTIDALNANDYEDVAGYDKTLGEVYLNTPLPTDPFVVTTPELVNHFYSKDSAILTHWDQSLHGGKGGHAPGGLDGIGTLELGVAGNPIQTGGTIEVPCVAGGPRYDTDNYSLFSDGSGTKHGLTVPAYENYIGENWTEVSVTAERCVWLSDRQRGLYGRPMLHRNGLEAFTGGPVPQVVSGAPVFQLVHSLIVDWDDANPDNGWEQSLISVVLPPDWDQAATTTYPIYLTSAYDLHKSNFGSLGEPAFQGIGEADRDYDDDVIGVLWNGGGSAVSQTKQFSSHGNAQRLVELVHTEARGRKYDIVMSGGSRGGTAALSIASNPYGYDYRVKYVIAETPQTNMGSVAPEFGNPTFRLIETTVQDLTGACDGWLPTWTDPSGSSGDEVAMEVLYGVPDLPTIEANYSNSSAFFLDSLANEVDGVVIRCGTHDFSKPFIHFANYYEELVARDIPVNCEVSYRFGHTYTDDTTLTDALVIHKAIHGDPFPEALVHYERLGESPEDYFLGLPFVPQHTPFVFEAPGRVASEQVASWTFTGAPGTVYETWFQRIENDTELAPVPIGPPEKIQELSGTLPSTGTVFSTDYVKHAFVNPLTENLTYLHAIKYTTPGGTDVWAYSSVAPPFAPWSGTVIEGTTVPVFAKAYFSRTSGLSSEEFKDVP